MREMIPSLEAQTVRGSQNGTRFRANGGRGRGGRNASALTSCVCRIDRVNMTEVKKRTVDGFVGRNEMDSHADTSCAGANWKAIELTGLTCDVSPFTQNFDAVKDVPVATCATAARGRRLFWCVTRCCILAQVSRIRF
jgi:hypothetical protein